MNERALLQEIEGDLQLAPAGKVIYLEGTSDPLAFLGLLGVAAPRNGVVDGLHQGTLVKGLKETTGSGGTAVRQRVRVAEKHGIRGIFGLVDGDGIDLVSARERFEAPFRGPVFTWKAYCIENLLVKSGWPADWGSAPDWASAMLGFAAYVALNHLHRNLQSSLQTLGLGRFTRPALGEPLKTTAEVAAALEKDKHLIGDFDVARRFASEVSRYEAAVHASLDEAHTHLDGKWLVNVFAPGATKKSPDVCREEWIAHAAATGGLADVRDLWQRLTGSLP